MLAALIIMRFLPDGLSYYVRAAMLRRRKARPEGAR
jgi:hypothetical protein